MNREKWLFNEIEKWQSQGIISSDIGTAIRGMYEKKNPTNILLVLFSIIGAVLVGMGIILISAKNWYDIPIWGRVGIAFLPLLIGQGLACYVYFRKMHSLPWREGVALFLTCGVFAVIALVGQIFHLPGDFGSYILVCGLLSLPAIYILGATSPTIIYLWTIINWTVLQSERFYGQKSGDYTEFWFLALAVLIAPYIYLRLKEDKFSGRSQFLAWITAIGGFFGIWFLNISSHSYGTFLSIPLVLYFTLIYLVDEVLYKEAASLWQRPFKIIGWLGNIIVLIVYSYSGLWRFVEQKSAEVVYIWPHIALSSLMFLVVAWVFLKVAKEKLTVAIVLNAVLLPAMLILFKGMYNVDDIIPGVIINVFLLGIGIILITKGVQQISLGSTNVGMVLVCFQIVLRFFDWDMDLLARGIAFLLIGGAFFGVNYYLIKKRKAVAEE